MTVLDSFYILFKSNAKEAIQDTDALDKRISQLAAKGKNCNEAEVKQLAELRKQRQETTRDIRDQTDATDKLGGAFVKMVENGAQAATSFLALGAIKSGILNAAHLNSSFEITSRLTGKSVTDLRALDAAFEAAGSSAGEFKSIYLTAFNQQAAAGLDTPAPREFLDKIRAALKQAPTQKDKEQIFQRIGLPFDEAAKTFLESPDDVYAKGVASGFKNAPLQEDEAKKARDFEKEMAGVQQELMTAYKALGNDILPYVSSALHGFGDFLHEISGTPGEPEALAVAGTVAGGWGVKKLISSLFGAGKAVVPGAVEGAAGVGAVAALAGTAALTAVIAAVLGKDRVAYIGSVTDKIGGSDSNPLNWSRKSGPTGGSDSNKKESIAFWESQGYTPEQAAAWAANEQAESSYNPNAVNGSHTGIFQWSATRRAKILAATDIDVATASHTEQLKAAAWEAQSMGLGPLGIPTDTTGATSAISNRFEVPSTTPYGLMMEAQKRAMIAAQISNETLGTAAASPLNSSSSISNTTQEGDTNANVKIDNVNVHTQATDADGMASAASDALSSHIRYAMSGMDDGRLA
jgi:hypothetical protein